MKKKNLDGFRQLVDEMHKMIHSYYRALLRHKEGSDGEYLMFEKDIKNIAYKIIKYKGGNNG